MIICAGKSESFAFARSIGVGLVDASINLSEICIKEKPNELLFVGSCGIYKNGQIFDIFESKNGTNIEISSLENNSYTPFEQKIINDVSCETLINSSTFITTNQTLAYKMSDMGCDIENMEFYSVLAVAKKFDIPANGIFVATNFCNDNAHSDFIKNHKKAKEILEKYLIEKGLI
ncbi:putative protein, possible nucleoside phosphorylase [Campylobacter pinnipediorum subsp. caledonicus]|uniref:Uncharacterized protein n=1 Tax=Campylobacter pinnipediorum subsp. caledonicus TaxID=1874362 RepID=A0A1S6U5B4_9BACT|nr:purine-nucleoside phosphorylase [Campylobacter pinnipediorum]AQW85275.1 putative protein, possible nucleoside phosphorylase [Campylobacter pinnipediorum subsp. caledonicus]AQW86882.1 putative protein, possible nucleoside phosphorylase [Campylobacter pinnipediorum subsp. caledonicus]OPA71217.1 purine-nucleoside phosphorylase [Campylobacter pinnipediorum subsp. caledonicus]